MSHQYEILHDYHYTFTVIDVNECLNSTCDQTCVDTFGSFECVCSDGYSLLGNGRSCNGIKLCHINRCMITCLCYY